MDENGSTITPAISSSPTMTTAGDGQPRHRQRVRVKRTGIVLKPNNNRVVIRPFEPTNEQRIERIIARIMSLSEPEVDFQLEGVMREFHNRHQRTRQFLLHRFGQLERHLLTNQPLGENRQM